MEEAGRSEGKGRNKAGEAYVWSRRARLTVGQGNTRIGVARRQPHACRGLDSYSDLGSDVVVFSVGQVWGVISCSKGCTESRKQISVYAAYL